MNHLKTFWKWFVGAEEPRDSGIVTVTAPGDPWFDKLITTGQLLSDEWSNVAFNKEAPIYFAPVLSPESLREMPIDKLCALKHALIDFDARAKRWKTSEVNSQAEKGAGLKKEKVL